MIGKPTSPQDGVRSLPFGDLYATYVSTACKQLRERVPLSAYELLTPEAYAGWESYLLNRLSYAGTKAARHQFLVFETVQAAFRPVRVNKGSEADALYRAFVGSAPTERTEKLIAEFPVLARLFQVLVDNWIATVAEFLSCFARDLNVLRDRFLLGQCIGGVVGIEAGLSEPHRRGRCVVRFTFGNGTHLLYKPRSLGPECHFSSLLDQLNSRGIPFPLKSARSWNRGEYGWMENVSAAPCATSTDLHAFYWRAGALLGLVYLAKGVDFHQENLIAAGAFPILVDLETLWHPQNTDSSAQSSVANSVLRTGFLPYRSSSAGKDYAWSALSGGEFTNDDASTRWRGDQNARHEDDFARKLPNPAHLPVFQGITHSATNFIADIQGGYRWIGEYFFDNSGHQHELDRWLQDMARFTRRRVFHSSSWYEGFRSQLTEPQSLRNEWPPVAWRRELGHGSGPQSEAETQALAQLDIPSFTQETSDCSPGTALSGENYFGQIPFIAEQLQGTI